MKIYLLSFSLLSSLSIFAQVGINTEAPSSTFDISVKKNGNVIDNSQTYGLQAPRLTRAELSNLVSNYGANQKGALIYITDVSGGTATGQRVNINAEGYYYFDGTIWKKINGDSSGTSINDVNIYKDDGVLTGNRTVNMNTNKLSFTSSSTEGLNHFSVDGSTFSVNANTNRVGIGTTDPTQVLDVIGTLKAARLTNGSANFTTNDFGLYNTTNNWLRIVTRGSDNGASTAGTSKIAFFTNANDTNLIGSGTAALIIDGGRVGINTNSPDSNFKLDVNGISRFTKSIRISGEKEGVEDVANRYLIDLTLGKDQVAYGNMANDRGIVFRTLSTANNSNNFISSITGGMATLVNGSSDRYLKFNVQSDEVNKVADLIIRSYSSGAVRRVGIGTNEPQNKLEITHGTDGNSGLRLTNLKSAQVLATNSSGDIISTTFNIPETRNLVTTLEPNQSTNSIVLLSGASSVIVNILDNCGQRISFKLYVTGDQSNWGFNFNNGAVATTGSTMTSISTTKISNQKMTVTASGLQCSQNGYNGTVNFTVNITNGNLVVTNGVV